MDMTFAVLDLLAGGICDVDSLKKALLRHGFVLDGLNSLLSDFTEKDWIEVSARTRPLQQEGDRILSFEGASIHLTPAGIRRWMDF